jgi:hypothetical protein
VSADRDRPAAMLRGLAFLSDFALRDACWSECPADVAYMFFHLGTRSRQGDFTRRARTLARRSAMRWLGEHPRLPPGTDAEEALYGYAYGACTARGVGLDTRALCRDLRVWARTQRPRQVLGFDPKREPPPSAQDWQYALVATHIAEGVGLRLRWSVRDIAAWRLAMQPYPRLRHRFTPTSESAFYAITHLVYVLNDYNLYALPRARFEAEAELLRAACAIGIDDDDVEAMGEAVDALLALGEPERDPLLSRARQTILALQNRDGSWGSRADEPYTRLHKTWVALDGLTRYGRREVRRPRLSAPRVARATA